VVSTGMIAYHPGNAHANSDEFHLVITGRQTHAAFPWAGVDPIVVASEVVTALQSIENPRPCSKIYRMSESIHPQQSNPLAATLDGPLVLCAPRLQRMEKGRFSLTQPLPMDCSGSSRATFVAIMQAADLRKCDDLPSRRRLDAAGGRTIFV
jgi:hypothetical protein